MSKKKNSKNSKKFKPEVPEKKRTEKNDEKKSGSKIKLLSLVVLIWSAIIYWLYIPAVSWPLGGDRGYLLSNSHSRHCSALHFHAQ